MLEIAINQRATLNRRLSRPGHPTRLAISLSPLSYPLKFATFARSRVRSCISSWAENIQASCTRGGEIFLSPRRERDEKTHTYILCYLNYSQSLDPPSFPPTSVRFLLFYPLVGMIVDSSMCLSFSASFLSLFLLDIFFHRSLRVGQRSFQRPSRGRLRLLESFSFSCLHSSPSFIFVLWPAVLSFRWFRRCVYSSWGPCEGTVKRNLRNGFSLNVFHLAIF